MSPSSTNLMDTTCGRPSLRTVASRDNAQARGFYDRLGGAYLRTRDLDFGFGVTAMEVSFLWADTLATLLKRPVPVG